MFWCGDFNQHHPLWETEENSTLFNSADMINPLLDLITKHNMQITLPLGIQIYETATSNCMHPDNVWRSDNSVNPITICDIDPSLHPPHADHLPITIVLDLQIHRVVTFPTLRTLGCLWGAHGCLWVLIWPRGLGVLI